ncbi:MAG: DNA gyrase inhibitor YacG [Deltaproteobacteria bacterium]|nr:DNA gyrase inhibitor YacG [Deltaproteobacteria bacterium]
MTLRVQCPQCRQEVPYEGNPHRPFCSERCRRIDLGTWASEGYAIPGQSLEVEEQSPDLGQNAGEENEPAK